MVTRRIEAPPPTAAFFHTVPRTFTRTNIFFCFFIFYTRPVDRDIGKRCGGLMGPRKSYNYGTFIAPPFEGSTTSYSQGSGAPFSTTNYSSSEHRVLTAGLQLSKHRGEVLISRMDDDVARVSRTSLGSRWSGSLMRVLIEFCRPVAELKVGAAFVSRVQMHFYLQV